MNVNELKSIIKSGVVVFEDADGETNETPFTFRLGALTSALDKQMEEGLTLDGWIEAVVNSWELDADGVPIPVTAAAIAEYAIPEPWLRLLQDEVYRQTRAGFFAGVGGEEAVSGLENAVNFLAYGKFGVLLSWYTDFRYYEGIAKRLRCSVREVEEGLANGDRLTLWAEAVEYADRASEYLKAKNEAQESD